jgi:hypothetical protein
MFYDKGYAARKDYSYAKRYSHDPAEIEHYREQLERITSYHYVSGFSHTITPVITDERQKPFKSLNLKNNHLFTIVNGLQ